MTPAPAKTAEPEVILGPDGEPLADWEIELIKSGEVAVTELAVSPGRIEHQRRLAPAPARSADGDDGDGRMATARAATAVAAVGVATRVVAMGRNRRRSGAVRSPRPPGQARPTSDDNDVADQHGARQRGRLSRPARRGLRLPSCQRLPGQPRRRLHPREAHPAIRVAQGRLRHRPQPSGRSQREEPGDARDPLGQRARPREGQGPAAVRGPDGVVPRREVEPRERRRPATT